MNISKWKIFDKEGSPINWFADSYLNLEFKSSGGKNATGYLLTDIYGNIINSQITNSGFGYSTDTSVLYTSVYSDTPIDITDNVNINYKDVSVFNPNANNVKSIDTIDIIDISILFEYPSVVYTSAIFLKPTSKNIIETEHLFILEDIDGSLYRPYDASINSLVFEMVGDDDEIKLFTVDEESNTIIWTDTLIYDTSILSLNNPISLNIGINANDEGVFERKLRIYSEIDNEYYTLGEIIINAEAIGEDERFRTLLTNFGLPDPKDFPRLFKEADINEDLVDYTIINPKSKQMILDQNKIIPYIGTYKALVNAIKWLGYDDIYVREWFKNVKENKKLSLIIPYDAKDRSKTLLSFSSDERKVLKKLNQLSLNYCITKETGIYDAWGTPETENCYDYNLNEVFVKLLNLKKWLEKNIIGVNARITDVTGEGIYFDTFYNQIYSTDNVGYTYKQSQSISPISSPSFSELLSGDSSINLTLLEYNQTKISDLNVSFADFINYVWDPNTGSSLSPSDPLYLQDPSKYVLIGSTISTPLPGINEVQWKLSIEKTDSGVLTNQFVTNPLWVYDNEIRFYNIMDSSSIFYDSSTDLIIILEKAYIKDPSNDIWEDSIMYSIYPDIYIRINEYTSQLISFPGDYSIIDGTGTIWINDDIIDYTANEISPFNFTISEDVSIFATSYTKIISPNVYGYVLESSLGEIYKFDNYINFVPNNNATLQYAIDNVYNVPLLSMKNFVTYDNNDVSINLTLDKTYYLDILDGKISMDNNSSPAQYHYINFNYDSSLYEQQITLNVEYVSPRVQLQVIDPSIYYWADPSGLSGGNTNSFIVEDNSIYTMNVNHIGNYNIEVFGYDGYNTIFTNQSKKKHNVWIKHPTIYSLINSSDNINELYPQTEYLTISEVNHIINNNIKPLYDRQIPLQGLIIETDPDGTPYIKVPSITYFQNVPQPGSINKFYNLTEHVISIDGVNELTIDPDYQLFFKDDNVKIIYFDKQNYVMIDQIDTIITNKFGNQITVDNLPYEYSIDSSFGIYLLNDTYRSTYNYSSGFNSFSIDISMHGYSYDKNQLVAFIIVDNSTGYSWGSSFRVKSDPIGSTHSFDYDIPDFITSNLNRYSIYAKHAFSTFTTFSENVDYASEENNNFIIHMDDNYQQYLLDNTFVMINILFDHDYVNNQWYDPSHNLINSNFYFYDKPINIDTSTLVILKSQYDSSTYLLNQKNVWTIKNNTTKDIILKVYNDIVPFIYDVSGYYDVVGESYDKYGNLVITTYEGLIKVN